jgi:ribonuclease HI
MATENCLSHLCFTHRQDRCVKHKWERQFSIAIEEGKDDITIPGLRCYTDGSLMQTSGSGLAIYRQNVVDPIHMESMYVGKSTIFQAEVNAITMACQVAQDLPDIRITILSNSQAAILAINKSTVLSRTVYTALEALTKLAETRFVRLQWVKGHNNSRLHGQNGGSPVT